VLPTQSADTNQLADLPDFWANHASDQTNYMVNCPEITAEHEAYLPLSFSDPLWHALKPEKRTLRTAEIL